MTQPEPNRSPARDEQQEAGMNLRHDAEFVLGRSSLVLFHKNVGVLAVYLVLTLSLTYPLMFNLTTAVPNDIGDPLLNAWILAWDAHALLTEPLHLFEANIFYPLPNTLTYSEHLLSTALLALPVQLFFHEPVLGYNLSLLVTFPLAGFGMYLLVLRWTGQRGAAFIGGLIFAFAPYRFAAIAHLQLLTLQWLPLALLCLDLLLTCRPASRRRLAVALTIFLSLQLLASWYLALYTALILGIYLLLALLSRRIRPERLSAILTPFLIASLVTVPFVLPYLTLLNDLRQARPLSLALSLAAAPTDFAAAPPFNRVFGPLTESLRSRPNFTEENTLFLGLVAPLLALVAVLSALTATSRTRTSRPGPPIKIYALLIILIISLLLTFPAPYATLTALLPPTTVIRVPARWLIPALFALAGLAAFGYAHLSRLKVKPGFLLTIISSLLLLETLSIPLPLAPVENQRSLNPAYGWLAQQPEEIVLIELPLHSAPAPEFPEVKRLYASTLGWWELVNGYSGYTPPRQTELGQALAGFPDQQSLDALHRLATVNGDAASPPPFYLLVHPGEAPLERTHWEQTGRWQAERRPALRPVGQFEGDYLYRLLPDTSPSLAGSPPASFGPNQALRLLGVELDLSVADEARPSPPHPPRLILYWQTTAPLAGDYTVFIHLRAADGFVRSQADGPPVSGHYPTSRWRPNEIIQDIHPLPTVDFGQIDHVAIGLYDAATGERLPASGPDGQRLPDEALVIPLR